MPKRLPQKGRGPKWERAKNIMKGVAGAAALAGTAYLGYKGYQKYKEGERMIKDVAAIPGDVVHAAKNLEPAVENYSAPHEDAYAASYERQKARQQKANDDWARHHENNTKPNPPLKPGADAAYYRRRLEAAKADKLAGRPVQEKYADLNVKKRSFWDNIIGDGRGRKRMRGRGAYERSRQGVRM